MFSKKTKLIMCGMFVLFIILYNAYHQRKYMLALYETGLDKISNGEYQEAQEILGELGDYKDSFEQIRIARALEQQKELYDEAVELFDSGDYEGFIGLFEQIADYKDSEKYIGRANTFM